MKQSHPSLPIRITVLSALLALSAILAGGALACPAPSGEAAQASAQVQIELEAEPAAEQSPAPQERTLVLRNTDGVVCVYENGVLLYQTDIPVLSLPAQDREALAQGIQVQNEAEMHQLLEDFGA